MRQGGVEVKDRGANDLGVEVEDQEADGEGIRMIRNMKRDGEGEEKYERLSALSEVRASCRNWRLRSRV